METAPIIEFEIVSTHEFYNLTKAQVISEILHTQGFGVRLVFMETVTTDALGNEVNREYPSRTMITLSTNGTQADIIKAIKDYDRAVAEVAVDAVKAKLAL